MTTYNWAKQDGTLLLHWAAKAGQLQVMQWMIEDEDSLLPHPVSYGKAVYI